MDGGQQQQSANTDSVALCESYGTVVAGELTAIMGGSGGGKSTLLNILSGRKAVGNMSGEISVNGSTIALNTGDLEQRDRLSESMAYVPQDVVFYPMRTPLEAVEFVAKLQHGPGGPTTMAEMTHRVLRDVGLGNPELYSRPIGGTLAGGVVITGLSFGEKKRLALACKLMLRSRLIMLDEITSGLDSKNALITVQHVQQVCRQHIVAAVMVVHQPNGYMFQTFDRLILLSDGITLFSDHVSKLSAFYEGSFGCTMPTSKHELPIDLLERSETVNRDLVLAAARNGKASHQPLVVSSNVLEEPTASRVDVSSLWKFFVVLIRSLTNNYIRNFTNVAARMFCYGACSAMEHAPFLMGASFSRSAVVA